MFGIQHEKRRAIVQMEAHAVDHDSGAKREIEALNQGHDVAVLIDRAHVNRVAFGRAEDFQAATSQFARFASINFARSAA